MLVRIFQGREQFKKMIGVPPSFAIMHYLRILIFPRKKYHVGVYFGTAGDAALDRAGEDVPTTVDLPTPVPTVRRSPVVPAIA